MCVSRAYFAALPMSLFRFVEHGLGPECWPWANERSALPERKKSFQFRMLTALAATSASVSSEIPDSAIIKSFARSDSGMVSVGENAVALVNERYR